MFPSLVPILLLLDDCGIQISLNMDKREEILKIIRQQLPDDFKIMV